MLEKMQKLALCYLWQIMNDNIKPPDNLRKWFNKERDKNGHKFFSYLVEPAGKIEKCYCLSANPEDESIADLDVFEIGSIEESSSRAIPFCKPIGSQSAQLGPVIKRSYSKSNGAGPKAKILHSTIKSFQEKAASDVPWAGYFEEVLSVFTREKLNFMGDINKEPGQTALSLAINIIPETKETVFLVFKDKHGRLPGHISEYNEYLTTMIDGTEKYSTLKSPGYKAPVCPLCGNNERIIYASGCSAAGINIFNIDREGAFPGITNAKAHLSYAICSDCADLLYIFKFHVLENYIARIAGYKALILPDINLEMKRVFHFIKDFRAYIKGLRNEGEDKKSINKEKSINIENTRLLRVLAENKAITTIDIIWADFGQKMENIKGIITDILPSRLKKIQDAHRSFNMIDNPLFPKYKIKSFSFNVNLSFLLPLFNRPGGKKAKKINASPKLFKLKLSLIESIYKKKNINASYFWEEILITARWYILNFFNPDTSSFGILNEGYSEKKGKTWLTFAGWVRHLAMTLEYLKFMEVLDTMENKRTFEPKSEVLKPYFSNDCGINNDYKAFAFILGILYGRVISIQGAKGVNVSANALTWLKRLTLSGQDLPELYIKVREKLLAYDDEKYKKTREIIHELGSLGQMLGDDIKLQQIECCYFLLLGQSIAVDVF